MRARIVIGANYGDEGKGTVVANLTKNAVGNVLNVLTNGGAQRGHSILTENGSITFQHFGSGTYHGADTYYSLFFIMNPMQFTKEYKSLIVKPGNIYRDTSCRWSTPYDTMANLISEQQQNRHASCCMGIWNTIKRYQESPGMTFDEFMRSEDKKGYLIKVRTYYERYIQIPDRRWRDIWFSPYIMDNFIEDCQFMKEHTVPCQLKTLNYEELIFENGQGLLLTDTGKDTFDTTPSNTGIEYSLQLLKDLNTEDIEAHYVTRPYLTRHGDGTIINEATRQKVSKDVKEDRTNHYNDFQGNFRYGKLNIGELKKRILENAGNTKFVLDVTHCDEMDRLDEFRKSFEKVNAYDNPLV